MLIICVATDQHVVPAANIGKSKIWRAGAFCCLLGFLASFFLLPSVAAAGVSLKNGNYYIDYSDIVVPAGDGDLIIRRTYNSRALDGGWFGKGWGSDFETWLEVMGDGTVVVHENGTGARNVFYPPKLRKNELNHYVREIINAAMHDGDIRSVEEADRVFNRLLHNDELRQSWWSRYVREGLLAPRRLEPGSRLRSQKYGEQQDLIRTISGFVRRYIGGAREEYDAHGRLIQLRTGTGEVYQLLRDSKGLPVAIVTSYGDAIHFDMNDDGTVARLWANVDGKHMEANYRYLNGMLVWSKDIDNNVYRYQYDKVFNMTSIFYSDGRERRITYDSRMFVRMVQKKGGETVLYDYGVLDPDRPDLHYFTEIVKKDSSGHEYARSRAEYHTAERADGSLYTQKVATVVNGIRTETIYNRNGLPLSIRRGKGITTFKYDKKGRMIEKNRDGQVTRLAYNEKGKITRVENRLEGDPDYAEITHFYYDQNQNLIKASDTKGHDIRLKYDSQKHVAEMLSGKGTLLFTYNERGKPIRIADDKGRAIVIRYGASGEIERILPEGKTNRMFVLKIMDLFNELRTVLEPAGVNFD
ncbi:MAG: hypothetical protein D6694_09260 [Gammaproteobacteria bacterium]|nr:MAG: hypothetical protein D6694_09260 [Gammaproteobacteria bacterium]